MSALEFFEKREEKVRNPNSGNRSKQNHLNAKAVDVGAHMQTHLMHRSALDTDTAFINAMVEDCEQ